MQTTPTKKEDIVRMGRESGPLQFADGSDQAAIQRLQQEFALGGYPSSPIAFPQSQNYGLPAAPSFANLAPISAPAASWPQQVAPWPQTSAYPPTPQSSLIAQAALLQRIANSTSPLSTTFGPNPHRLPLCDLVDEGADYTVQIELPGVKRENVDVSCFERGILVTASAHSEIDAGALLQSERGTVISFRRAINLPGQVTPSGVKATLHDGILTISLPKSNPTEGPRRVPVSN